ncbi:RDD family protein [Nonomuraea lactucae]|uniref:RDD family protein n=1 Tax=Nonomuraea lactucae TaxID=2249762 RepID=UPI0013B42A47|nr:RDD family protein [Nonomuraea lactucae]
MGGMRTGVVPAEWWERLAARLIEGLVFGVFYYILFIALWGVFRTVGVLEVFDGRLPGVFAWLLAGVGYAGYDWAAHSGRGRTFGKAIMKIRVVPDDLPRRALLKRALVYPGPAMLMGIPVVNVLAGIFVFAVGMLILIDRPLQRGPHDRLAGTLVVKDLR